MNQQTHDTTAKAFKASRADARTQQERILKLLEELGDYGATGWEASEALDILYPCASAALSKLAEKDLVHDSGRERIATKHDAAVFVLGPRPAGAELPRRASAAMLKKELSKFMAELDRLRAHVIAMNGERHECWSCGAEIEVIVRNLEAITNGILLAETPESAERSAA